MKNRPNIYPHLVAAFIEENTDGGTVEAIAFITRSGLADLKSEKEREKITATTLSEAKIHEANIFSHTPRISREEGGFSFSLDMSVKGLLTPIREDILFLYSHRLSKTEGEKLSAILQSPKDEPYNLILEYKKDRETGSYFIKKMALEKKEK